MGMTIAEKIIAAAAGVDSVKGVLRYRQTRWKIPWAFTISCARAAAAAMTSPKPS